MDRANGQSVLVAFTGGTISVSPSRDTHKPALGASQLATEIRAYHDIPIETVDLYRVMSESLTWQHVHRLATFLMESVERDDFCGVVVSHGTDTMEEVAYLMSLLRHWDKPIVFTGAMRHSEILSADGPENLVNAIRVASAPESAGRGILVVMNQEIHAARYVVKGHSTNVSAFCSPGYGPMGTVVEGHVRYHWSLHQEAESYKLPTPEDWPRVELVRMSLANSPLLLRACLQERVDGVVIEGFGSGHVPDVFLPEIQHLIDAGIRVWVVPRAFAGHPLLSTYGTAGSEISLQSLGVTMEEGPGYKARLRLMLEIYNH